MHKLLSFNAEMYIAEQARQRDNAKAELEALLAKLRTERAQ